MWCNVEIPIWQRTIGLFDLFRYCFLCHCLVADSWTYTCPLPKEVWAATTAAFLARAWAAASTDARSGAIGLVSTGSPKPFSAVAAMQQVWLGVEYLEAVHDD